MNPLKIFNRNPIISTLLIAIAFILLNIISIAIYNKFNTPSDIPYEDKSGQCNVFGIALHGALATYIPTIGSADDREEYQAQYGDAVGSEDIIYSIEQANSDDKIKAIMIEVDSNGGLPVAGEEVMRALKASTKPTVGIIRQSGLSASYLAVTGAQYIFASRNSDIGSIGVTASYLENINKDKRFIQLSVGKYKDSGDPDKPITEEERKLIMRDIKIIHQNFIEDVATNRNISIESVTKIADGSSVLGVKAKELGLIDEIGGWVEAGDYLEGVIDEKPVVCW